MRRTRAALVAVTILLTGSIACTPEDFAGLLFEVSQAMKESQEAEIRRVAAIRAELKNLKPATQARDRFLRTRDRDQLDRARELMPHDPELAALEAVDAVAAGDGTAYLLAETRLIANVAIQRRVRGLPPDPAVVKQEASRQLLDGYARYLVRGPKGVVVAPDPKGADAAVFSLYCTVLGSHNSHFPGDGWVTAHHLDFGVPCP